MALKKVFMTADAYGMCVAHTLSTEKEEVMGLLMGNITEDMFCHVSAIMVCRRSDKRKDRVEISPEQLSTAAIKAESFSNILKKPLRIVGWYHSHPHITASPSAVDVRTQASYQLMDSGFLGLIFSVFNQDSTNKNRMQVCCFQSISTAPGTYDMVNVDFHIIPSSSYCMSCIESYCQLPKILREEENEYFDRTKEASLDFTSQIHNDAVYTKSMVQIIECMSVPLIMMMEQKLEVNEMHLKQMKEEEDRLRAEIIREKLFIGNCNETLETII